MWTNRIVKNVMIGAGTAVGAGAIYSMYQHQRKEDFNNHSVYKAQEVDVHKVTPPVLTDRPEVLMGDSIVLDDFTIRDKLRSKLQGSTADQETANKLKGARDYAVGAVETTVKDAAQSVKGGPQRSSIGYAIEYLQGYKDQLIGAVETRAKDFQYSVKHARDEAKHKHEDLSERMKANKEHLKEKVDKDVYVLEGKAKDAGHKVEKEADKLSGSFHKGVDKLESSAEKAKVDIMNGAHDAKVAIVHGTEVALDKTMEIATDLAKKAEHAKDVTIVKSAELAEKSKEVSKEMLKKSKSAADTTVAVAKVVGATTAAKTKEAANVAGDVFLKTGKAAESVVKPVAGTVVNATEQVGEKYEQAKDHLYVYVKDARDKAAAKKAAADAKRNIGMDKKQIEKEIENINDVQRY